uniref:Ribosomal silencing factor RsfS n=1 Tax=Candidatus Kentrum sp. SD TaxID=2126332 RepID=A0A450Y595_9GAMM|nr:MAG: ribosome-associated protein [Candidatus Kentron sp. SD]VFK40247.1 MAG: ribosome-associated protein [Candidatus Kentron sp. SD]VFK78578.1 MAG: ribosome-associated protein [Candidatus Kentron sp. SD]
MNDYTSDFSEKLARDVIVDLEAIKAIDITLLDVRALTTMTDFMIIATGRSKRHARALAENVITATKKAGYPPLGIEGKQYGEWILVDLCDVIVHVMISETRELYQLEKLWHNPDTRFPATTGRQTISL